MHYILKRNPKIVAREEAEGREHLRFSVLIAYIQLRAGRGFLFEHPRHAASWTTKELHRLRQEEGVFEVPVDLCRFGLKTSAGHPALKPTLLLTNIEELATVLHRRCNGMHSKHQPLLAGEAGLAAKYTPAFVDAILRGLRQHVQAWVKTHQPTADYWELKDSTIVRHHRTPRRALFSPKGVAGCPEHLSRLASERITNMQFLNGPAQVRQDDWRNTPMPYQAMPSMWTGTTTFPLQDPILLPADWHQVVTYIVQAAAHPIHYHLTEETAVQSELAFAVFPTRRILGGAHDVGGGSDAAGPPPFNRFAPTDDDEDSLLAELEELNNQDKPDEPEEKDAEGRVKHALRELPLPKVTESIHPEMRREIYRVHRNLGHPTLRTFTRALKHAGVKPEVLTWVKNHFQCPICERKQQPSLHRPGKLQRHMGFNEVVGVDLIFYTAEGVADYILLNILCWGTDDLQIVEVIDAKRAHAVLQGFLRAWVSHYGPPGLVIADQGREFMGDFADRLSQIGIPVHYINTRSPWENGRTEKAGGVFKSRLETVVHETSATTDDEIRLCIAETTTAHNRYYNRSGFSPYQRAFGTNPRLPGSLLSDDKLDKMMMLESAGDEMKRAWTIREEAAKSWLKWQDDEAVRRSLTSGTRAADVKEFQLGELVYVWRKVPTFRGWTGPGTLIALKDNSAWISMRGYLIKASIGQVRKATSEEHLGAELVKHLSEQMLEDLESNTVKLYRDVEDEGEPTLEDGATDDGYSPTLTIQSNHIDCNRPVRKK